MRDDESKRMQLAIAVAYDKLAERAEVPTALTDHPPTPPTC